MELETYFSQREEEINAQLQAMDFARFWDEETGIPTFKPTDLLHHHLMTLKIESYHPLYITTIQNIAAGLDSNIPERIRIIHLSYYELGGRRDGLEFCKVHRNELKAIREKIDQKEKFINSRRPAARYGTSPRSNAEGYLAEMKDFLKFIEV